MDIINENRIGLISAFITTIIGLICLGWWFSYDPSADLTESVPGMDNKPSAEELTANEETVQIGEFWSSFEGSPSNLPGEWPQFRGLNSNNISTETLRLADQWPDNGPEILWSVDLGEGHAAPAVKQGRVYLLDYDETEKADALRCFSLEDGKELWRRWYRVKVKRNHGMSRTVPAVSDSFVVTIGPRCHVMCVNAITGEFQWGIDLEEKYGTKVPFWYTGQCPLIDNNIAVIAPAGSVLMMGVDCRTGEILWETPNPDNWQMSHVSVMPMILNGKRMYIYSAIEGLAGISADGDNRGEILWKTDIWSHSVLAPSPVITETGLIFLTAGYGAGSMVLQISQNNGIFTVEKQQEYLPKDGLASEQQTPLYYKDHFFGIQPKDAGPLREQFVCYNPKDFTQLVWSSGETNRFGLGPYVIADNKIFILNDDGVLTMIEASVNGYRQLAQAKVLEGHDAWGPMAIVSRRMLLRDSKRMVCIDLSKK